MTEETRQTTGNPMATNVDRRTLLRRAAAAGLVVPAMSAVGFPMAAFAQNKSYKIAYLTPGLDLPFWRYLSDGIKQQAATLGAPIEVKDYDSRNSAQTQLQNAQDAITRKTDLIIISPTDSSAAPEVLSIAKDAKVPVVIADIGTDSGDYVSFVISSNEKGANEAGKILAQQMEAKGWKGKDVVMITISLARRNGQARTKGFKDAMQEAGSKVVQYLESKNYTRAEAQGFASDMMTAHPEARGFFSEHDEATLGSLAAIEDAGKAKDIVLVGFDGSPETVTAIQQGKVAAASMQQPVLMGREAMRVAWEHLQGKTPDKTVEVPTILVTAENVNNLAKQLADTVFPVEGKQTPAS